MGWLSHHNNQENDDRKPKTTAGEHSDGIRGASNRKHNHCLILNLYILCSYRNQTADVAQQLLCGPPADKHFELTIGGLCRIAVVAWH